MPQSPKTEHIDKTPDRKSILEIKENTVTLPQKKIELLFDLADKLQQLFSKKLFASTFQATINIDELSPPKENLFIEVSEKERKKAIETQWLLKKIFSQSSVKEKQAASKDQHQELLNQEFIAHLAYGCQEVYSIENAMELIANLPKSENTTVEMLARQICFVMNLILFDVHNRFILSDFFSMYFAKFIDTISLKNEFGEFKKYLQMLYDVKKQCNLRSMLADIKSSFTTETDKLDVDNLDYKAGNKKLPKEIAKAVDQLFITKLAVILPEHNKPLITSDKKNSTEPYLSSKDCQIMFSEISFRVSFLILRQHKKEEMVLAINFWIEVAHLLLRKYLNVEAAFAILTGIHAESVTRIKNTEPLKNKRLLDDMLSIINPTNNFESVSAYSKKKRDAHLPITRWSKSKDQRPEQFLHAWTILAGLGRHNAQLTRMQYSLTMNYAGKYYKKKCCETNLESWTLPMFPSRKVDTRDILEKISYEWEPLIFEILKLDLDTVSLHYVGDLIKTLECIGKGKLLFKIKIDGTIVEGHQAGYLLLQHLHTTYLSWPKETKIDIINKLDTIFNLDMHKNDPRTDVANYSVMRSYLLNNLTPLSQDTTSDSSHVDAPKLLQNNNPSQNQENQFTSQQTPISYFWQKLPPIIKRKALHNESQAKVWLKQHCNIPENFQLAAAFSQGDCFFDSVAQGLNQITGANTYDIKILRQSCQNYANQSTDNWVKNAINFDERDKDNKMRTYEQYLEHIVFTAQEMEELESKSTFGKSKIAVWGRPKIEGRMFCDQHDIQLHIIEIQEDGKTLEYLVDKNGEGEEIAGLEIEGLEINTLEVDYANQRIIHIVNYRNHYVPLLNKNLSLTSKAEHDPMELSSDNNVKLGDITGESLPDMPSPIQNPDNNRAGYITGVLFPNVPRPNNPPLPTSPAQNPDNNRYISSELFANVRSSNNPPPPDVGSGRVEDTAALLSSAKKPSF